MLLSVVFTDRPSTWSQSKGAGLRAAGVDGRGEPEPVWPNAAPRLGEADIAVAGGDAGSNR